MRWEDPGIKKKTQIMVIQMVYFKHLDNMKEAGGIIE